ncbi:hypothetical protein [Serratia rubidaea]|uniref:hypothetical protein n=1 Tax=Serratia rubidaea TaxID=61652 RepID=UPI00242B5E3B|nr:hypothetical protein [Serratia rubidaea]MCR0998675.1 hypothetical protein [Serratia rubidaea]
MNKQLAVERIHVITPEIFGDVVRADDYDNLLAEYKASQDALKSVTELWNEQRQRIAELEAAEKVWESAAQKHIARAEAAEAKLATPVRLPQRYSADCGVCEDPNGCWLDHNDVVDELREKGFKVEGDEQ